MLIHVDNDSKWLELSKRCQHFMYAYKGRYYPTDALTPDTMKIIDVTADKHNGVGVWLIGSAPDF